MPAATSIELYTLRDACAHDFRAVLRRLGEIGFVGVETAGLNGLTGDEVRATLDEWGLVASSAHVNLAAPDEFARALEEHAALGCSTVVVPVLPPKWFADRDAIKKGADALNRAHE